MAYKVLPTQHSTGLLSPASFYPKLPICCPQFIHAGFLSGLCTHHASLFHWTLAVYLPLPGMLVTAHFGQITSTFPSDLAHLIFLIYYCVKTPRIVLLGTMYFFLLCFIISFTFSGGMIYSGLSASPQGKLYEGRLPLMWLAFHPLDLVEGLVQSGHGINFG